ncbi:UDP-N-acetylglucosamine 2-epimerase (non-hydrolyzing) [Citrobacter portucalensis]|nr:UDP-N-acetylglucosamine 2-epimerase (non-hydrolyzing) [Citrobacter portucalensis]
MLNVIIVFGTRPEAIKMAPVIHALNKKKGVNVITCITAQHREMLDQVLKIFNIIPDYDLNIMKAGQSLNDVTAEIVLGLKKVLQEVKPDLLLVHGDTSTTFSAALAAYYEQVPVGHVEAGLRTGNIYSPWPEEANRRLTSIITQFHFAPTNIAKNNLVNEGISVNDIVVTGNTVIDSLFIAKELLSNNKELELKLEEKFDFLDVTKRTILVTGHRRENFGDGLKNICKALLAISKKFDDIQIIYPLHMNPNVRDPVRRYLGSMNNIFLIEPLEYLPFVYLMNKSYIILTDSGGIQEEAPSLGKPVLVMRDTTERPEAVLAGTVKLVGTNDRNIINQVTSLLESPLEYGKMANAINPYGDGRASDYIADYICNNFKKDI